MGAMDVDARGGSCYSDSGVWRSDEIGASEADAAVVSGGSEEGDPEPERLEESCEGPSRYERSQCDECGMESGRVTPRPSN